jgi:hypothetical protein
MDNYYLAVSIIEKYLQNSEGRLTLKDYLFVASESIALFSFYENDGPSTAFERGTEKSRDEIFYNFSKSSNLDSATQNKLDMILENLDLYYKICKRFF